MQGRSGSALGLASAIFIAGAVLGATAPPAAAKIAPKPAKTESPGKPVKGAAGKPALVGTYGDWNTYVTQGAKDRTCYALAQPKERLPAALKRDPAYVFISTRPAENVKNEISVIMGFPLKDGGDAKADIGEAAFDLIAKGTSAWIKNAAEERQFVEALKKGSRLVVKAPSIKGNVTTDSYSLSGLSQALDRVAKECQ